MEEGVVILDQGPARYGRGRRSGSGGGCEMWVVASGTFNSGTPGGDEGPEIRVMERFS